MTSLSWPKFLRSDMDDSWVQLLLYKVRSQETSSEGGTRLRAADYVDESFG